jgi:alkanesulfonate monooxygenase SsuD/methylene tetrahydromethanopterin reductase-like flavin-dependent oxidoreductase (luciferase family)
VVMGRTACAIPAGRSFPASAERVKRAEELGYEAVFVGQTAGFDALSVVSAYAALTDRIRIGTSITPIHMRAPAALAQAAVAIDTMSDGRLELGLGVSHRQSAVGWYGAQFEHPLADMREYFGTVRAIVGGHEYVAGPRWPTAFALGGVAARPKLRMHMAALSPGMLRLAGEVADGVMLYLCSPRYIREVVLPELQTGAERVGRDLADIDVYCVIHAAFTDAPQLAAESAQRLFVGYLRLPAYRTMMSQSGFDTMLAAYDAAADEPARLAAISVDFVTTMTACGDISAIAARLDAYREAGVTVPCVAALPGFDAMATLGAVVG